MNEITIGTRGSQLALWQAEFIKKQLEAKSPVKVGIQIIKTRGDKIQHLSFDKMEGKGFFTKEIEEALLAGEIDIAVHSLKDLMTTMPAGLAMGAVGFREDNREIVLIKKEAYDPERLLKIKKSGIVGSSSVRRQCQIAAISPDLILKDLRGNVPTRINKLREGQYDAIVMALAGIKRLGLELPDLEMNLLRCEDFLPAPGQGILAVQVRENDERVKNLVSCLNDPIAETQGRLERGLLARFEGGCQLPLGAYSIVDGDDSTLNAVLGHREGSRWTGLTRASFSGKKVDIIIEDAYNKLMAGD